MSVLVAGILMLLIWKLATHLHDKREYRRFEKETKNTKWAGVSILRVTASLIASFFNGETPAKCANACNF